MCYIIIWKAHSSWVVLFSRRGHQHCKLSQLYDIQSKPGFLVNRLNPVNTDFWASVSLFFASLGPGFHSFQRSYGLNSTDNDPQRWKIDIIFPRKTLPVGQGRHVQSSVLWNESIKGQKNFLLWRQYKSRGALSDVEFPNCTSWVFKRGRIS